MEVFTINLELAIHGQRQILLQILDEIFIQYSGRLAFWRSRTRFVHVCFTGIRRPSCILVRLLLHERFLRLVYACASFTLFVGTLGSAYFFVNLKVQTKYKCG